MVMVDAAFSRLLPNYQRFSAAVAGTKTAARVRKQRRLLAQGHCLRNSHFSHIVTRLFNSFNKNNSKRHVTVDIFNQINGDECELMG